MYVCVLWDLCLLMRRCWASYAVSDKSQGKRENGVLYLDKLRPIYPDFPSARNCPDCQTRAALDKD